MTINRNDQACRQGFKYLRGFTLIEVMITVAIITIIASIAIPSYLNSVMRARRSDAVSSLLSIYQKEESFYARYAIYTDVLVAPEDCNGAVCGISWAPVESGTAISMEEFYSLTVALGEDGQSYVLSATPRAGMSQTKDDACSIFTLDESGVRGMGDGDDVETCW